MLRCLFMCVLCAVVKWIKRLDKPNRKLLNQGAQQSLLKLFGYCPNLRFDSFCVGVMSTVGYKTEGTARKMN